MRIIGSQAWLTLKGYISDMTRKVKFEYEIPLAHARVMMADMCPFKWKNTAIGSNLKVLCMKSTNISGDNAPLIVGEIELPSEDTEFPKPSWLGKEITSDGKIPQCVFEQTSVFVLDGIRATAAPHRQKRHVSNMPLFSFELPDLPYRYLYPLLSTLPFSNIGQARVFIELNFTPDGEPPYG